MTSFTLCPSAITFISSISRNRKISDKNILTKIDGLLKDQNVIWFLTLKTYQVNVEGPCQAVFPEFHPYQFVTLPLLCSLLLSYLQKNPNQHHFKICRDYTLTSNEDLKHQLLVYPGSYVVPKQIINYPLLFS